ncbi:hypothetical protein Cni_G14568 [Canna indica]|uniref:DUF4378 domain-containing protein n=1 Tax=Canna indica TaxID=4628 RepID=A0AAQ3KGK1_9LILI|nr:hypothetical protein Cni_G14568 [Canna indica]
MAKRPHKRPSQLQKHNAGCMGAFISLFDFRHGPPTPKLLSDRKPESSRRGDNNYSNIKLDSSGSYEGKYKDANNDMGAEVEGVDSSIASVKTLMEKELFGEHSKKNLNGEAQCTFSKLGCRTPSKKNTQQRSKRSKVTSDVHINKQTGLTSLDDQRLDKITLTDNSSLNFDLIAFLIEFYTDRKACQEIHANCDNKIDLSLAMKAIIKKMNDHPDEFDSQLDQKEFILYKALADIFEAFANQNFVDGKQVDKATQSEEFMDALEILNLNKDVVLKLLEDRNSHFYKLIQDIQKIEVGRLAKLGSENYSEKAVLSQEAHVSLRKGDELENEEPFHKQNRHSFFFKKDKSKGMKSSKQSDNSETLNTIVVLKPSPSRAQEHPIRSTTSFLPVSHHKIRHEDEGDRVASSFSLKGIKKRLRHIIGGSKKERHAISMDGVLHKIPIGYKASNGKDKLLDNDGLVTRSEKKSLHDTEKSPVVFPVGKKKESAINRPDGSKLRISNGISVVKPTTPIYEEAKKHITEMLDNGDKTASLPRAHVSKSLGRLFSMPEFDVLSPRASHGCDRELALTSEETTYLPLQQFNQEDASSSLSTIQNLEIFSCSADHQNDEVLMLSSQNELTDNHLNEELSIVSELSHEGCVQNVNAITMVGKLCPDKSNVPVEPNDNIESDVACKRCCDDVGFFEVESHSVSLSELSPRPFLRENLEAQEGNIGKQGRSSPASILEKFISEDFTSSKLRTVHPLIQTVDTRANLRTYYEDKQARIKYIETVLHASGISDIHFSERWHLADKLLEPSLFDELGISCSPHIDDPKLLFDCINEALEEIQEKYFKCTPWVSLLAPNAQRAPVGRNIVQEVSRRIERHIPVHLPNTADHVVTKDLDDRSWMDLQFETEDIIVEIWDTALDDLVEETIFDLWLGLSDDW